jgi:hybrid cluster-associated redox disulfide protein
MAGDWIYDPDMPIDRIMRLWPATITVLMRHRMLCIGCPIGPFHTVPEACRAHGIDEAEFVRDLGRAIACAQDRLETVTGQFPGARIA